MISYWSVAYIFPEFATTSESLTTMNADGPNQTTLVITVSATVLGTLLLLVLLTLMGLICVVQRRRRPTEIYRVNRSLRRNTYEIGVNRETPKGESAKHLPEHELLASVSPAPPVDPEYATISEWRKISGLPQPQPGVGVTNPFYASSSVSIPNKCNASEPPGCIESSSLYGHNLEQSCTTRSLQDVRSTGLREGGSTQGQTGSMGRHTHTLATSHHNSGSSHIIPSRAVRRNESVRADISTSYKPTPPPRPVLLKRGSSLRSMGGAEPYLMAHKQSANQWSPLTQSMRAGKAEASGESIDSIEDVGNDNYIIVSK